LLAVPSIRQPYVIASAVYFECGYMGMHLVVKLASPATYSPGFYYIHLRRTGSRLRIYRGLRA